VNITEPAVCVAKTLLSAVCWVELRHILILAAMLHSNCLNSSLLEVFISSKNECVFVRELREMTLQIIFDAYWASTNVGSKHPIPWKNSSHASSWRCYFHCQIEETGSSGIICIICHQVLHHLSEHGSSSMGKYFLETAYITKLNELTELEVSELTSSTVDGITLAIQNMQGSWGITIVSLQRKFMLHTQVDPYWLQWQTKHFKLAAKDFETSKFHQDISHRYHMLQFISVCKSWIVIWNVELQLSYTVSGHELVLPSTMTITNICTTEYALTVDAIRKQLPTQNEVTLACAGWTLMNKLVITTVIASYGHRNCVLHQVQLTLNEFDFKIISSFKI